jgi:DNA adenine methylase
MKRPYKTYNGGKNGSGTYQAIINQIPKHNIFISGFVGNCGVLANKQPAPMANIAIDLDAAVIEGWRKIPGIIAINADSTGYIGNLIRSYPQQLLSQIFVFLDPPYLSEVRSGKKNIYKHEMQDIATHKKLVSEIIDLPVNICLSHYPCKFYDEALNNWRKVDFQGRTRSGMRTERLYMNYPPPQFCTTTDTWVMILGSVNYIRRCSAI